MPKVSPRLPQIHAESAIDRVDWIDKITGVIASLLNSQIPVQVGHGLRAPWNPIDGGDNQYASSESGSVNGPLEFDPLAFEDSATSSNLGASNHENGLVSTQEHERPIDVLRTVPGNDACADCWSPDPDWASLNLGILLCIECSGVHRNLGVHISKVRSLTLDVKVWEPSVMELFQSLGNDFANSIWEGCLKDVKKNSDSIDRIQLIDSEEPNLGTLKPQANDPFSVKERFIHAKYAEKAFVVKNNTNQTPIGIGRRIWTAVENNDKRLVYSLIVCFDADVNTTYEQATRETQEVIQKQGLYDNPTDFGPQNQSSCAYLLDSDYNGINNELDSPSSSTKLVESIKDEKMNGWTLLHLACYTNKLGMVELLLQYGAQVDARDSLGRTPLHLGVAHRRNAVSKLLLSRGASANAVDGKGKTPLQTAMELGAVTDEELFVLLS
ncbi:hypothetical protein KP509_28G014600 [Ceratopteris richardii]|uniref:Arf-GAP domain-containing protein n=1 Tax=Ceratopteris richardii TaxID=49495 RepID=A0A8T2R9T7_CERRI|nr:hypothetical protein KP509_28G014600 [Ceratopteris richardii]